jgi:hypothetical protein
MYKISLFPTPEKHKISPSAPSFFYFFFSLQKEKSLHKKHPQSGSENAPTRQNLFPN